MIQSRTPSLLTVCNLSVSSLDGEMRPLQRDRELVSVRASAQINRVSLPWFRQYARRCQSGRKIFCYHRGIRRHTHEVEVVNELLENAELSPKIPVAAAGGLILPEVPSGGPCGTNKFQPLNNPPPLRMQSQASVR